MTSEITPNDLRIQRRASGEGPLVDGRLGSSAGMGKSGADEL